MPPLSIIILFLVLIGIATRKMISQNLPIWVIMALGGLAVILTGQISIQKAIESINLDVILYLFGIFVVAQAAESSGYLENLTDKLFSRAKTEKQAMFIIIFVLGLMAALLMNDTVAIMGTPIIIQLCSKRKELLKPLLLALAYAITLGSVFSPLGNPQNLLIALDSNLHYPFIQFSKLIIPTLINLLITFIFLAIYYRKILNENVTKIEVMEIKCTRTVKMVRISVIIFIFLILAKVTLSILNIQLQYFQFCFIALFASIPILLFSRQRYKTLKDLDWGTLIFFVAMFILMQSVWDSEFFQNLIKEFNINIGEIPIILIVSVLLSQLISNVPLVALYLPVLDHLGASHAQYIALAAGSTIAGNLFIIGAASTIIIIQNAERRKVEPFGFIDFAKIGIPLTIINLFVYYIFIIYFLAI
ncbi:MAG: anion transporter [Desulfobacteraceae bacterium]|nr:anion transporter [Desulfobacteraceae bacterium]